MQDKSLQLLSINFTAEIVVAARELLVSSVVEAGAQRFGFLSGGFASAAVQAHNPSL